MAAPHRRSKRLDTAGALSIMQKNNRIVKSRSERGVALISVLCLLLTAGAMIGAAVALSQLNTFGIASAVEMQQSRYVAEGAAARIQFFLAADIASNGDRSLGETDYESEEYERLLADNVEHVIDYYGIPVRFRISDTVSGMELSNATAQNRMKNTEEASGDWETTVSEFFDKYGDYVDTDDNTSSSGMESGEYDAEDLHPLPRNAAMQYREEIWYIPGARRIFRPDRDGRLSTVRLIIDGVDSSAANPSVFTADKLLLRTWGSFTSDEADEVLKALKQWRMDRKLLSDQLDGEFISQLKQYFSWSESGIYTIDILSAAPEGRSSARLSCSILKPEVNPAEITNYLDFFFY